MLLYTKGCREAVNSIHPEARKENDIRNVWRRQLLEWNMPPSRAARSNAFRDFSFFIYIFFGLSLSSAAFVLILTQPTRGPKCDLIYCPPLKWITDGTGVRAAGSAGGVTTMLPWYFTSSVRSWMYKYIHFPSFFFLLCFLLFHFCRPLFFGSRWPCVWAAHDFAGKLCVIRCFEMPWSHAESRTPTTETAITCIHSFYLYFSFFFFLLNLQTSSSSSLPHQMVPPTPFSPVCDQSHPSSSKYWWWDASI